MSYYLAYCYGVKLAFATKKFGPFTFKIDRPKGFVKNWKQPDGTTKTYTYPVDYGYLNNHIGEDGEGLDFFVGDEPSAPIESFMKLHPDGSEDETKFMIGLTADERKKVLALYSKGELVDHRKYKDVYSLVDHLKTFKKKKTASTLRHTLIGAGIGAGANALLGDQNQSLGDRMFRGGLTGGVIGGAIGSMRKPVNGSMPTNRPLIKPPPAPPVYHNMPHTAPTNTPLKPMQLQQSSHPINSKVWDHEADEFLHNHNTWAASDRSTTMPEMPEFMRVHL